jgi:hypothetical protein
MFYRLPVYGLKILKGKVPLNVSPLPFLEGKYRALKERL